MCNENLATIEGGQTILDSDQLLEKEAIKPVLLSTGDP